MKTITIPTKFGYPTLEITINGKEQTFASGVEIEVEDAIAEAIENAIDLAPKQGRYKSRLAQLAEGSITELTTSELEGVETIAVYALAYCRSLLKLAIPNSVKNIEGYAFYSCNKLESLVMGNNVKKIGTNAFDWCASLMNVYLPVTPPILVNINAFANIKSDCIFYCKTQESLDAYKKAENWITLTGTYTFKVEE